jgi:glyoxylase-like metal-dependent hydrolase (beta-lactamase superfamily II)
MIELATGIRYLGTVGMPPTTAIYLATDKEESCIIEPGPNSGSDTVIRLVSEAGVETINKIVATHIHLDHAGASRALLDRYSSSMLYLYKGAAKYLVDTTQLAQSARQVLGELYDIWGGIPAVQQDRIIEVGDGDSIPIGSLKLRIIYTPGHAPYHMSVFEENTRILHTGDAVGMYIKNRKTLWPASPLPSFRYDMEMQSLHKIISLNPDALMIPHYGPVSDVKEFLEMNLYVYETWHQVLSEADNNMQVEEAARKLVEKIDSYSWIPAEPHFWFTLKMHVAGFLDYERKSISKKEIKKPSHGA